MPKVIVLIKPGKDKDIREQAFLSLFRENDINPNHLGDILFSKSMTEAFYREKINEHYFPDLLDFMKSGNTTVYEIDVESQSRLNDIRNKLIGPTNPLDDKDKTTLRGKYCLSIDENGYHSSESLNEGNLEYYLVIGFLNSII